MASEIRVDRITHTAGVGTITPSPTGVHIAGIVTGTTFSGSGASLTSLPAASLTGTVADARFPATLPATSAANLTNVPAANVVGVHTSLTVTNATTTGSAVVGGGVTISESGIEASGIGITVANINGTQIGGRRNLIINGAMQVAQYGTSSTDQLYSTVDRMRAARVSVDENPNFSQATLSLGGHTVTPYLEGHRKAFKILNGNQTSGAGSNDVIAFSTRLESQDIANSGWNYTDPNSFVTLQFWVKSSVAQNFYIRLFTQDGTQKNYPMETGTLTADTWKKVIKTIPGHADLQFDNDANRGLDVDFSVFRGTDQTASGVTLDQWANLDSTAKIPDMTSTFYTTNDATFMVTGIQLEVGSQATAFEHRSFGEELTLCQRYFYKIVADGTNKVRWFHLLNNNEHYRKLNVDFPTIMRTSCTVSNISYINSASQSCTAQYSCEDHVTFQSAVNTNQAYAGLYGADFSAEL